MTAIHTFVAHALSSFYIERAGKIANPSNTTLQFDLSANINPKILKYLTDWKPNLRFQKFSDGDLAIHRAVAHGSIEHVKYLSNRAVINQPGAKGYTPLHYAASGDEPEIVKYLLENGADVDGYQSSEPSPLIKALFEHNYEIANILLDWKANVEAMDDENWRPLHYVASQDHQQLTRRLMDSGCELDPQNDEGETPFYRACSNNCTEIMELFFARGIGNIAIQTTRGLTYAHVAASKGRQDVIERLIQIDPSLTFKTDNAGFDPLCIAAYVVEPDVIQVLLAYGASPDGPAYGHMTPLALAAAEGAITAVDILLRAGAKIDKAGSLLRTPLMWAVLSGCVRTAHHLLKAGANPFLRDELVRFAKASVRHYVAQQFLLKQLKLTHQQGLSVFDLAVGKPAINDILSPWGRPPGSISPHDESQIGLLLQFISRTARTSARMIRQGIPAIGKSAYSVEISLLYVHAIAEALLTLIRAHEAGRLLVPEWIPWEGLKNDWLQVRPGDNRTAVPVKRAEIIWEFRSLFADSDLDAELACNFCCAGLARDFYICSVCWETCCRDCQHALSVLSIRERLEEFGRLRQSRTEVVAVLKALRPINHHDARTVWRVLSQGLCLQQWVSRKNEEYRKWRTSRMVYKHFRQDTLFEWKAVHTMNSILSLSARPENEETNIENVKTRQNPNGKSDWGELTEEWNDMFAFNPMAEDLGQVCVHHSRMYLEKPRLDGDSALDSSGKLSAEFFDCLADKYEAAMNVSTGVMDFLKSKRITSRNPDHLDVPKPNIVRNAPIPQHLPPPGDRSRGGQQIEIVDSAWTQKQTTDDSDDSTSDSSSSDDSSSESSDHTFPGRGLEDDAGILEDLLDSLLAKRNLLAEENRLTEDEELVLNTAWNMAQAIVYQDTPRPSLKEISDQGECYCTAPTTPVPSNSGNTPSSYGTPRSMSPVSGILDLDE